MTFMAPQSASAIDLNDVDVENRSYLTFTFFADIFNDDCFFFGEDDEFTASFGLIIGEWSLESETIALFFTINYVEVDILSATEATITGITALDNRILVGKIETNDGDNGYFLGIESQICDFPARKPGNEGVGPIPDNNVPRKSAKSR